MNTNWIRIDTKTNKVLLKSKLEEDDIRNENWENNENDMSQEGFSKKYNNFNDAYEFQYWIDKDICDSEEKEITKFNEKCDKWNMGKYIERDVYISINNDIDFNNFNFIKDEKYNEEWNNLLFTYYEKNVYIKFDSINIEVIMDNFNNKYIEINKSNKKIDYFMEKLENRIMECVNKDENKFNIEKDYEYKHYKDDNGNYKFKVKKDNIEPKEYKNANIYIKINRLWKLNYQKQGNDMYNWGVSIVVDKIIEN